MAAMTTKRIPRAISMFLLPMTTEAKLFCLSEANAGDDSGYPVPQKNVSWPAKIIEARPTTPFGVNRWPASEEVHWQLS